jgi:hypothetical protein
MVKLIKVSLLGEPFVHSRSNSSNCLKLGDVGSSFNKRFVLFKIFSNMAELGMKGVPCRVKYLLPNCQSQPTGTNAVEKYSQGFLK